MGKSPPVRIGLPRWRAPVGERTADYLRSIARAGGDARYLPPSPNGDAKSQLDGIQGLVLSGGGDVNPALYGQKRHRETDRPHPFRDRYEIGLLEEALRRDIPVLAICRGHQLLNVLMGGELVQHIADTSHQADEETYESAWHVVSQTPRSRLASALGNRGQARVNSRHHQGVAEAMVGRSLRVTSVSPDGWIEGLEGTEQRWLVSVQWHPERREMAESMTGLFRAFVEAAREMR